MKLTRKCKGFALVAAAAAFALIRWADIELVLLAGLLTAGAIMIVPEKHIEKVKDRAREISQD